MSAEPRVKDPSTIPWLIAGTAILGLLFMLVWHFRHDAGPAQELARKASRVDLVGQMQAALASAAEAEKSAVLAVTDEESQRYADQARAATRDLERERQELAGLLAAGGSKAERDLLGSFSEAFVALQKIDEEVLGLAVKNTNLKAYALAFGPAAAAVAEFEAALARVAAKLPGGAESADAQGQAYRARLSLLRVQALLAPHIAEEDDGKMDQLEATMRQEEVQVRLALDSLARVPRLKGDADLAAAVAALVRYQELKGRILALSRENTNVRSLALSLNQKRKAMLVCVEALGALRQTVLEEPVAGVTYGRPVSPR
jgi:hypothetical protein